MKNPRAWLQTTVWRLLANRRRSEEARPQTAWPYETRAETTEVEAGLEIRFGLAAAARRLTGDERRLLELLALGHSHREIGKTLGIGWKSVGARVQRLRRKLHSLLERAPNRR